MTEISILKKQVQLFQDKIKELTELKAEDESIKEAIGDLKSKVEEALRETVDALKIILKGKPTSEANSGSMSEITLIQLTGIITEEQLKLYTNKYKDYPMILKYLRQVGEKNGYHVSFKSEDEAKKIIRNLEIDTKDFLDNYDPKSPSRNHTLMITESDGNYFDILGQELSNLIENNEITITRIL